MILEFYPYCASCSKLLLGNSNNDELISAYPKALTKSGGSLFTLLIPFYAPTPSLASASAPGTSVGRYTNKDFKQATKFVLKLFF